MSAPPRRARMPAPSSPCATTPTWLAPRSRSRRSTARQPTFPRASARASTRRPQRGGSRSPAPAKARYLVRGYVTASPIEGGAEVDIVWDVFTSDKKRDPAAQRRDRGQGLRRRRLGDDRRCGAEQRRRQMRRRPRRLSLQHSRGGARERCPQLRAIGFFLWTAGRRTPAAIPVSCCSSAERLL